MNLNVNITIVAVTVKPAAVEPTPVVNTALGTILEANLSKCDFPVPGSPTKSKWDSDLVLTPVKFMSSIGQPPASTTASANLTGYKPYI